MQKGEPSSVLHTKLKGHVVSKSDAVHPIRRSTQPPASQEKPSGQSREVSHPGAERTQRLPSTVSAQVEPEGQSAAIAHSSPEGWQCRPQPSETQASPAGHSALEQSGPRRRQSQREMPVSSPALPQGPPSDGGPKVASRSSSLASSRTEAASRSASKRPESIAEKASSGNSPASAR
jgi:hypothetical protein